MGEDKDTLPVIGDTGWLTKEELLGGTTIVYSYNRFNDMRRLEILWMVRPHWPAGAWLAFNW